MDRCVKKAFELAENDWLMIAGGTYQVCYPPLVDGVGSVVVRLRRHKTEPARVELSLAPDLIVIVHTEKK